MSCYRLQQGILVSEFNNMSLMHSQFDVLCGLIRRSCDRDTVAGKNVVEAYPCKIKQQSDLQIK